MQGTHGQPPRQAWRCSFCRDSSNTAIVYTRARFRDHLIHYHHHDLQRTQGRKGIYVDKIVRLRGADLERQFKRCLIRNQPPVNRLLIYSRLKRYNTLWSPPASPSRYSSPERGEDDALSIDLSMPNHSLADSSKNIQSITKFESRWEDWATTSLTVNLVELHSEIDFESAYPSARPADSLSLAL